MPVSDPRAADPPPADRAAAFSAGEEIAGRYLIVRFIARGGMGEVFEADDKEIAGRVALKTLGNDGGGDLEQVERFRREIQLARKVTHPNVCRIFDLGIHRTPQGREVDVIQNALLALDRESEKLLASR